MAHRAQDWTTTRMLTREQVSALANSWEPEASQSTVKFRKATCVMCARPMSKMWHIWLDDGEFKKEIHMCKKCGKARGLNPKKQYRLATDADMQGSANWYRGGVE